MHPKLIGASVVVLFLAIWSRPDLVPAASHHEGEAAVDATVLAVSAVPDPATAPYPDCLSHIQLAIGSGAGGLAHRRVVSAVMWAFRARLLQEPATLNPGDRIEVRIIPFEDVEAQYGQIMRVDDARDMDSPRFWGELIKVVSRAAPQPPVAKDSIASEAKSAPPAGSLAPGASQTIQRMLRVFEASAPGPIGLGGNYFVFNDYNCLLEKDAWRNSSTPDDLTTLAPIEAILSFRDQLKSHGIELVVVFPPPAAAVFPDYATNIVWDIARDGRVDVFFLEFLKELRRHDVEAIDLLPEFVAQRFEVGPDGRSYPIYFRNDGHWSSNGGRIAAKRTAERLKAGNWYAPYRQSGGRVSVAYVQHLKIGQFRDGLPPVPERMEKSDRAREPALFHRVVPAADGVAASSLGPEPGSPVQLITDSFGNIGSELQASFCEHLRAELGVPVGMTLIAANAVDKAPRQWAARADLHKTKVVVWLIPVGGNSWKGPWARVVLDRSRVLSLCDLVDRRVDEGVPVRRKTGDALYFVTQRSIAVDPRSAPSGGDPDRVYGRIIWKGIRLGDRPMFRAGLGISREGLQTTDGAEFQVLIDGEIVGRKASGPRWRSWFDWSVNLSEYARREIDFELRIVLDRTAQSLPAARWGEPEIWDATLRPEAPDATH